MSTSSNQFYNTGSAFHIVHAGTINNTTNILPNTETSDPIDFDVPPPDTFFTGRKKELELLNDSLQRNLNSAVNVESLITIVSGLGGIGKTQLVREYVRQNESKYDGNVIWIHAENEKLIADSFKRLSKDFLGKRTIDANGREKSVTSIVQSVYQYFHNKNVLFIFDNVDSMDIIRPFLIVKWEAKARPYILFTSRLEEWSNGIDVIRLRGWSEHEAIEFVIATLSDGDDHQDIELLVEDLQCFPLALRQATSYIKNQRLTDDFTISKYRSIYNYQKKELLDSKEFQKDVSRYSETSFTTWNITIRTIERDHEYGTLALKMLHTIAYFRPDDIHRRWLIHLVNEHQESNVPTVAKYFIQTVGSTLSEVFNVPNLSLWKARRPKKLVDREEVLRSAVHLLAKYSMINCRDKQSILGIHRVVQDVIKVTLKSNRKEKAVLRDALILLKNVLKRVRDMELEDAIFVYEHALQYSDLLKEFFDLPNIILMNLIINRWFEEAVSFGYQILEKFENIFESNHSIIENIKFNIKFALSLKNYGFYLIRNEAAYLMYDQVYKMRLNEFGENDEDTVNVKLILGCILLYMRKTMDATTIFEEVLDQLVASKYYEIDIGDTICFIGHIYYNCNVYEESLRRKKMLLAISKSKLSESHPHTLNELNGIRRELLQQRNFYKAKQMFFEIYDKWIEGMDVDMDVESIDLHINNGNSLQMLREVYKEQVERLGENHEDCLLTLNDIGLVLLEQMNYADAITVFEEIRRKDGDLMDDNEIVYNVTDSVGPTHSNVENCESHLTIFTRFWKRLPEGFVYKYENGYEDTILLMCILNGLERLCCTFEDDDDSKTLFLAICDKWVELGDNNEIFLDAMHFIAIFTKDVEEKLEILERVHPARVKFLGENHVDTLLTLNMIGRYLMELNATTVARIVLEKFCVKSAELEDYNEVIIDTMYKMALIHFELGNIEDSLMMYTKAHEERVRKNQGKIHQNYLSMLNDVALVQLVQHKCANALEIFRVILNIEAFQVDDIEVIIDAMRKIALFHFKQGNIEESLRIYRKIHEECDEVLGESHEITTFSFDDIGLVLLGRGKCINVLVLLNNFAEKFRVEKKIKKEASEKGFLNDLLRMAIFFLDEMNYTEALHVLGDIYECNEILWRYNYDIYENVEDDIIVIFRAMYDIGWTHIKLKNYEESLMISKKLHIKCIDIYGLYDTRTLGVSNIIGIAHLGLENYPVCMQIFEETCKHISKLGYDNKIILEAMEYLGLVYSKLGNYEKSLEINFYACAEYNKVFGENHPVTIRISKHIDEALLAQKRKYVTETV